MLRKLTINKLGQNTLITLLQIQLELEKDNPNMEWANKQLSVAINNAKGVVGMTQKNRIEEWLDMRRCAWCDEEILEDQMVVAGLDKVFHEWKCFDEWYEEEFTTDIAEELFKE